MRVRRFLTATVVAVGVLGFGGGADAAPTQSVHGSGMVTLPYDFDDAAGDTVRFQVQAQGGDGATRGTFNVVHLDDAGGLYAHAVGDVRCVVVSGGVAYTTGIIRRAWFRDFPGWNVNGTAVAITIADGGRRNDALGFDFEFFGRTIEACQNRQVPGLLPVEAGDFTVR